MELWGKAMMPMRKVCNKVAKKMGMRKTGIVKLRHDVRTCEYEDVQILWEMLKRNETELTKSATGGKKGRFSKFFDWARCAPFLCRGR